MNHKERIQAILHFKPYDRMPVVSFGYWSETLAKWAEEGHITKEDAESYARFGDHSPGDMHIMEKLGFDLNWSGALGGNSFLLPSFEEKILKVESDGTETYQDSVGHIQQRKPGIISIPAHIGTLLTGREAWEAEYLPRLTFHKGRIDGEKIKRRAKEAEAAGLPICVHCGSLFGRVRDMLGVVEMSYLMADDEELFQEIVDTNANLCHDVLKEVLSLGIAFDYAHFWEDICFKNGPLVSPSAFDELVGHHYKRITDLLLSHGVDIVSLDCDGLIDSLIPTWLQNGVNTMFPIEVGTWQASIAPWRAQYGRAILGIGGMDKRVFAQDKAAIDGEIDRLAALVDLGGYIPCVDHRIAPDAEYALVAYYCEQFRKKFG